MPTNEKYSYGNFWGQTFLGVDASEFSNSDIIGSNFAQEDAPDTDVFPAGVTGIKFIRCNLDNVKIPAGCTIEKCTNLRVKVFDGEDCIVNESLEKIDTVEHYQSIAFWRDL